ncbi:thermonuclease family protein [Sphingobacterium lactis]|uniref:thermonuclease family protein n=1 Tax=Sphingobacterium lactis TaxID=797291 RepID=UPI003EC73F9B
MKGLIFLIFLYILTSCALEQPDNSTSTSGASSQQSLSKEQFYSIRHVVDGDTFWIEDGSPTGQKIRFIGIDAPENRNAFKKKKEYYGEESKAYLMELLEGKKVRLELDVDPLDPFGRTLAYVYLENGEMVNELIVRTGNGILMTIAPNIKYEERFYKAQQYAREHRLGLWAKEIDKDPRK